MLPPLTPELLSSLLGYASIGCWVIAQAPQVLENYTQQSCEGLALPFLLNWLCGDITNVIGCLLTDQKEFQTLLATYFCIVDLLLAGQYAYYTRLRAQKQRKEATRHHHHARHGSSSGIDYESVVGVGGPSNGNGSAFVASNPTSPIIHHGSASDERSPLVRAPSIHSAALDVARAVEKIEQRRRSQSARRKVDKYARSNSNSEHQPLMYQHQQKQDRSPSVTSPLWSATTESTTKSNSYLSAPERESRRGRPRGRPIEDSSSSTATQGPPLLDLDRDPESGRRSISTSPRNTKGKRLPGVSSSPSTLKRTTSTTGGAQRQRAAGVVFMSVFLMVGVGRTASWSRDVSSIGKGGMREGNGGEVLVPHLDEHSSWQSPSGLQGQDTTTIPLSPMDTHHQRNIQIMRFVSSSEAGSEASSSEASPSLPSSWRISSEKRKSPPDNNSGNSNSHYQRVIGRASAWICTTLYLTSRLPQIWKNYTRRSVEGLSILLFVFAFMGNATYVGSIMLNPGGGEEHGGGASGEERAYYLLEALPYLLGSGGTLIFDLTIMCQAVVYGSAKPIEPPPTHHHHHHHHSSSHSHHHRSRSRSSYRPGPASGKGSGQEPPHLRRIGSESRSFTSLGAVDEESQLLSDGSGAPYHDYNGGGDDLTATPRASQFDVSPTLGNDREGDGQGKMKSPSYASTGS